jgi:hypothetical protein
VTLVEELELALFEVNAAASMADRGDSIRDLRILAGALRARIERIREPERDNECEDPGFCVHASCALLRALTGDIPPAGPGTKGTP